MPIKRTSTQPPNGLELFTPKDNALVRLAAHWIARERPATPPATRWSKVPSFSAGLALPVLISHLSDLAKYLHQLF